jgi:hypothetical protein
LDIELTQGKIALIDDEDYELVSAFTWCAHKMSNCFYATSRTSRKEGKRKLLYMHRLIMNAPKGIEVDHINGNGLDNRRSNLRLCSHKENSQNKHRRIPGNKGISWHSRDKKWTAQYWKDGIQHHVGYFLTEEQAIKAYNEAVNSNRH